MASRPAELARVKIHSRVSFSVQIVNLFVLQDAVLKGGWSRLQLEIHDPSCLNLVSLLSVQDQYPSIVCLHPSDPATPHS